MSDAPQSASDDKLKTAASWLSQSLVPLSIVILVLATLWFVFMVKPDGFASVSALILVGLAAFIGLMNFLTYTHHLMELNDVKQPFGLPEGTVRAILTIAFIVLVGVMASYLATSSANRTAYAEPILVNGRTTAVEAQKISDRYAAAGIVTVTPHNQDGKETGDVVVHVLLKKDNALSDDISKQILTMLSTIMAAMIGFYFGAKTDIAAPNAPTKTDKLKAAAEAAKARAEAKAKEAAAARKDAEAAASEAERAKAAGDADAAAKDEAAKKAALKAEAVEKEAASADKAAKDTEAAAKDASQ
ncbi:hypothetical protein [Methylopila turkensis]|uniref:Uncharacterized protein n=1 Tax=Methylopila turkensis TaxID=1437816 RepID=A0A9W6JSQ0_9HYPH|nr:hypothetical protein [Methylopila turkensis]GLK81365.1 hypothetical protein GCM10008174_31060 [Methylopila turkensis]